MKKFIKNVQVVLLFACVTSVFGSQGKNAAGCGSCTLRSNNSVHDRKIQAEEQKQQKCHMCHRCQNRIEQNKEQIACNAAHNESIPLRDTEELHSSTGPQAGNKSWYDNE